MIEHLTRWLETAALVDQTANIIAKKFISKIILRHGRPEAVLTDNATNFKSNLFSEVLSVLNIKRKSITAYSAHANGAVERANRSIIDMMASYSDSKTGNWHENLKYITNVYNTSFHTTTGETPFFLVHCKDQVELPQLCAPQRYRFNINESEIFNRHWTEAIELAKAHQIISKDKQKHYYDKNAKLCTYNIGDRVLLRICHVQTGKFYQRWDGVYIVTKQISDTTYVVQLENTKADYITHVNRMKLWKTAKECGDIPEPQIPTLKELSSILKPSTPQTPAPTNTDADPPHTIAPASDQPADPTATVAPPKRGRGRPRKA